MEKNNENYGFFNFELKKETKEETRKKHLDFWMSFLDMITSSIVILVFVVSVRVFVLEPFTVEGVSMEPTLHTRDYIFIDKLTYRFREPKRGEIVVFEPPDSRELYIKRIIGLPGESIEITEKGEIYIYSKGGEKKLLSEGYIQTLTIYPMEKKEIPEGHFFVMGDNRFPGKSRDSRAFGPVPKQEIRGKAFIRIFPISDFRLFIT